MNKKTPLAFLIIVFLGLGIVTSCQSQKAPVNSISEPTPSAVFEETNTNETVETSSTEAAPATPTETTAVQESAPATISIDITGPSIPVGDYLLGTNLPAWLSNNRLENDLFLSRTLAAGVSLIRIPGGSWSNHYDWLACERGGSGIDETAECFWPWAARPTDFLNFLRETALEGMYTVNMNGTTKEAAALVAFFNGSVDDDTVIGVDVRGRDWGKVSDWSKLRSDGGNPEPIGIQYWEIGNEIYGGTPDSGADCASFGWEEVWTCDGTEYVNGVGSGADRKEGYLEYQEAMQAVDPTVLVGAVGVPIQSDWNNWGNEVIAAAGDVMDFYIIHQYAFFETPQDESAVLAEPQTTWPAIMSDVQAAFEEHAGGRNIPVAVTEYNLFSVGEQDTNQLMTRTINALFMADTVGQMITNGVQIAAQWDLANGQAGSGSDYGLVHAETYEPYPQYYIYRLWSQFGEKMLPVTNLLPAETVLSVYAGQRGEDTITILAINKTEEPIAASILLENSRSIEAGYADVLAGDSLDSQTITYNGKENPETNFSDAPSSPINISGNPIAYTFVPYSVTLIQLDLAP